MTSKNSTDRSPIAGWNRIQSYLETLDDLRRATRRIEIEQEPAEDDEGVSRHSLYLREKALREAEYEKYLGRLDAVLASPFDVPLDDWNDAERSIVRSIPRFEDRLAYVEAKIRQPSEALLAIADDLLAWFEHVRAGLAADGLVAGLHTKAQVPTTEFAATRMSIYKSRVYQTLCHLDKQYRLFEWLMRPTGRIHQICGRTTCLNPSFSFGNGKKLQEHVSRRLGCDPRTLPEVQRMRFVIDKMCRTSPKELERRRAADIARKKVARASGNVKDTTAAARMQKYRAKKRLEKEAATRSATLDEFIVD